MKEQTYGLSLPAFRLAQEPRENNMRSMALHAIFMRLPVRFTRVQAMEALQDVYLGSGDPGTYTNMFIKNGYMTTEW